MAHSNPQKRPFSPRSPALVQAIRRALSPTGVTGGLLAVSLVSLTSPSLALELSDLDGRNGFTINGVSAQDYVGSSVSGVGDINGDGIEDLIIGAPHPSYYNVHSGRSYVVFGTQQGFPSTLELSDLDGTHGFAINGINQGDRSGASVNGAGDVNGDGIDDVIIGAFRASPSPSRISAGQSYVVFGGRQGFPATVQLSELDGTDGFVINGINSWDYSGAVSNAGDVNGDGIDDILIGARGADPAGQSYVVFGSQAGFPAVLELADLDGNNGFMINGIHEGDSAGVVSGAGDVNGDGIADVIIGAPGASPDDRNYAGQSYVVFGTQEGFPAILELAELNGTNGFMINGIHANVYLGTVSDAGDVNGDGIDDILIGAPSASPNNTYSAGQSYVVFGSREGFPAALELANLNGRNGFAINGIQARDYSGGGSVSGAGDVNGDGIDDILISTPRADPNGDYSGQSYVVFGTDTGFPAALELADLDGTNGFMLNGIQEHDESGASVSGAGDINGDGFDDLIIGAPRSSPHGQRFGQSYVIFGGGPIIPVAIDIDIKPDTPLNKIDPNHRDRLPVAILSTSTFDAIQVQPDTVQFGPARARDIPWRRQIKDVGGDGNPDLVLRFRVHQTGIQCGDTQATLTGRTFAGEAVRGIDLIRTVGCEE